jgi:hypothetical protein
MRVASLIFVLVVLLSACYRIETYPPEPEINYISFQLTDSIDILDNRILSGNLRFSFIDGDGDVGADIPSDTSLINTVKHVFIDLFKKEDGVFVLQDLAVDYQYRIPYFEPGANNPVIKGEIIVSGINFYSPFTSDTMRLDFYMKDRAGNKSNIEQSQIFVPSDSLN